MPYPAKARIDFAMMGRRKEGPRQWVFSEKRKTIPRRSRRTPRRTRTTPRLTTKRPASAAAAFWAARTAAAAAAAEPAHRRPGESGGTRATSDHPIRVSGSLGQGVHRAAGQFPTMFGVATLWQVRSHGE